LANLRKFCWLLVVGWGKGRIGYQGTGLGGERREQREYLFYASLFSLLFSVAYSLLPVPCCLFPVACCCWVGILLMKKKQSTKNNQPRTINQEQRTSVDVKIQGGAVKIMVENP
jgi:hypothetical protein